VTPKRPKKTEYCAKCCSKATQTGVRKPRGDSSYISSDGYKMIKISGEYTASGKQVYRREHVLVMEDHMGRERACVSHGRSYGTQAQNTKGS
jgi:hypothetical protein